MRLCSKPRYYAWIGDLRVQYPSPDRLKFPGFWRRLWIRLRHWNVRFEVDHTHYWDSGCFSLGTCEHCGASEADE
jgi:hypothetical protein